MTQPDPPAAVTRPIFTQRLTQLTYLHWRYDPEIVRPLLPAETEPDVLYGAAWVGLIPFAMRRVTVAGMPPVPYLADFLETNVRTYTVGPDGRRGVAFLSLEASRLLPALVARATYRLPYRWAQMRLSDNGGEVLYTSRRCWPGPRSVRSRVRVRVGAAVEANELDHFLTARWGLHVSLRGRLAYVPVSHPRWPLRAAEVVDLDDELVLAAGLPAPSGAPRVLYSPGVRVLIGRPERLPAGDSDRSAGTLPP